MHGRKPRSRPGIGLYSYEQEKNTTPFQYAAQIVVGVIVVGVGVMLLFEGMRLSGAAMVLIGAFFAHAGVIFWFKRRLRKKS
jgi:hypothetical protein